ncbi:vWA domain-containing protein [Halobellus inordinatus]|uniref:vWA domain-containing protein n=1 Tax=Halobellus inordinatus TaxID=1126236 RepID=UPI00210AD588|nr:vWA domain-containing protein [Halobellus inordinatus]
MTDNDQTYALSRRKVLGALGAVGIASAGAGLGTTAYFNDTESFENNTLTAGTLDLKIDWQQSYYGPTESWEYVNAHPDHDGDGEQSIEIGGETYAYGDESRNLVDYLTCSNFDQNYAASYNGQEHLIELDDVKPGDKGEVTFSLHLCDNPGYIWMRAADIVESGGVNTEPERVAEGGDANEANLAENVDVRMWYDQNCDNRLNSADIMLTIDVSGSMLYSQYGGVVNDDPILGYDETTKIDLVEVGAAALVQELIDTDADARVGVVYFNGSSGGDPHIELGSPLTSDIAGLIAPSGALNGLRQVLADIVGASTTDPSGGAGISTGTYIGEGVLEAQAELANNGRVDTTPINVVLSDGNSFQGGDGTPYASPTSAADDARASSPAPATNVYTIGVGADTNDTILTEMAGAAGSAGDDPAYFRDVPDPTNLVSTFQTLADLFTSEVVFFEGTLAEALGALDGDGIHLDGDRTKPETTECFEPEVGHCIGFAWSLPLEAGNELQGDSVAFDLSFYTEQCRHNDGVEQTA